MAVGIRSGIKEIDNKCLWLQYIHDKCHRMGEQPGVNRPLRPPVTVRPVVVPIPAPLRPTLFVPWLLVIWVTSVRAHARESLE